MEWLCLIWIIRVGMGDLRWMPNDIHCGAEGAE
jgi:hypothetical protein